MGRMPRWNIVTTHPPCVSFLEYITRYLTQMKKLTIVSSKEWFLRNQLLEKHFTSQHKIMNSNSKPKLKCSELENNPESHQYSASVICFSSLKKKSKLFLHDNVSVTDRVGSVVGDRGILGTMTDRKIGGCGKGENINSNLMNSSCTSESFQKYRMTYWGHHWFFKNVSAKEAIYPSCNLQWTHWASAVPASSWHLMAAYVSLL